MLGLPSIVDREQQRQPRFQTSSERSNDHAGPIRLECIEGCCQSSYTSLQLLNEILLVTSIVGREYDLLRGALPVIGDVDVAAVEVEQFLLSLMHGQVFPHDHHAIVLGALRGAVAELRDRLRIQTNVLKLALLDHLLFDVLRTSPWRCRDLITSCPLQPLPGFFSSSSACA